MSTAGLKPKNIFIRLWNALRRQTTADIIDEQLQAAQVALITNQSTADHYSALAQGCRDTIKHLTAMRNGLNQAPVTVPRANRKPAKPVVQEAPVRATRPVKLAASK